MQSIPFNVPKQMVAQRRSSERAVAMPKEEWEVEESEVVKHAQLGAGAFSAVFRFRRSKPRVRLLVIADSTSPSAAARGVTRPWRSSS